MSESHGAAARLADSAASVPFWWHSIDLGHGVVTEGRKSPKLLAEEWGTLQLPDLRGRSVLDVGAWDGWFSFEAEREGAQRVVALDRYVWSVDFAAKARLDGSLASHREQPGVWRPDALPGSAASTSRTPRLGAGWTWWSEICKTPTQLPWAPSTSCCISGCSTTWRTHWARCDACERSPANSL